MLQKLQTKIAVPRTTISCSLCTMSTFAQRLERARTRVGLNQSELARLLGVSPQAVQKWEGGENIPRGKRMQAIASHLKVSIEELLTDKPGPEERSSDDVVTIKHPPLERALFLREHEPAYSSPMSSDRPRRIPIETGLPGSDSMARTNSGSFEELIRLAERLPERDLQLLIQLAERLRN